MLQRFDEGNRDLLVNVNAELLHRDEAGVSLFESVVQGGDAVWQGLRLGTAVASSSCGSTSRGPGPPLLPSPSRRFPRRMRSSRRSSGL